MSVRISVPGAGTLELEHVIMDLNGTLTNRGALIADARPRILRLSAQAQIHFVSADTFGTLGDLARSLQIDPVRVSTGHEKLRYLNELGANRCAVVGNGANDMLALTEAALGIVVIGPEGASARALQAADCVCTDIVTALDLLLEPQALSATLRP